MKLSCLNNLWGGGAPAWTVFIWPLPSAASISLTAADTKYSLFDVSEDVKRHLGSNPEFSPARHFEGEFQISRENFGYQRTIWSALPGQATHEHCEGAIQISRNNFRFQRTLSISRKNFRCFVEAHGCA